MEMKLIIGDKKFSSWSLRPWLVMKTYSIDFEEHIIHLNKENTSDEIRKFSAAAKVPVLVDQDLIIWDSMAILEYLNEKFPDKKMWPRDAKVRALARAVSNEMHSGFSNLRTRMPHNLDLELGTYDYGSAEADIARVQQIWKDCLVRSKGPFLFGEFSIADAMYAPVVNRFISYGVPVSDLSRQYMNAVRNLPAHQQWIQEAKQEK